MLQHGFAKCTEFGVIIYFRIYKPSNCSTWISAYNFFLFLSLQEKPLQPIRWNKALALKGIYFLLWIFTWLYIFYNFQCWGDSNYSRLLFPEVTTAIFEVIHSLSESSHSLWRDGSLFPLPCNLLGLWLLRPTQWKEEMLYDHPTQKDTASFQVSLSMFSGGLHIWFRKGNGTPLQYSCLENPIDRGAW